tara:strand:+ start:1922 stop:3478 length:1557 start_codon:yes stop_codon:yes gene_type:complete
MSQKLQNKIVAVDKSKHAFASFKGSIRTSTSAMKGLGASIVGFIGIASLMRLKDLTKEALDFGTNIQITASKIGVTTKELQSFRLAGQQFAGITSRTLDMGLQRFSRRLGEANQDTGELKGTLLKLGINTKDADGNIRGVTDVLMEYADGIKNAESSSEQLRLAFKGFDSEGAVLVELFKNGSEEMRKFMLEAQSTGAVMSDVMSKKAQKLNDVMALQSQIIKTQVSEAFVGLGGILVGITTLTGKVAKKFNEFFTPDSVQAQKDAEQQGLNLLETFQKIQDLENEHSGIKTNSGLLSDRQVEIEKIIIGLRAYIDANFKVQQSLAKTEQASRSFGKGFSLGMANLKLPTLAEEGQKFAVSFQTGLSGAFDSIIDGTKSVGESLKDLGKTLIKQAIKMLIFRTILAPITGGIGNLFGGGGSGKPQDYFARGGSVSKNKPIIVGDGGNGSGAEMFIPHSSGSIIPNSKLGGGGVTVVQNISLSGDVSAQIRSQVMSMLPGIADASRGAVLEAQRRGQPS